MLRHTIDFYNEHAAKGEDPTKGLYPVERNPKFVLDREITPEREAIT